MKPPTIQTVGALRQKGYRTRSVKQELRENLIARLPSGEALFSGIVGYDDTVIPQLCNAILSRHDILLLGLGGQAKTRILRMLPSLLDERTPTPAGPVRAGSGSDRRNGTATGMEQFPRGRAVRHRDLSL